MALDLPFEVVHAGTDVALFAELESAMQREALIIQWVYTPHWAPIKHEGEWVEFPPYTPECYKDPSWGVNPDRPMTAPSRAGRFGRSAGPA